MSIKRPKIWTSPAGIARMRGVSLRQVYKDILVFNVPIVYFPSTRQPRIKIMMKDAEILLNPPRTHKTKYDMSRFMSYRKVDIMDFEE